MEQDHGSERPSTSSALNVREEYQIEQPTTTSSSSVADVENQSNASVNIAGGEFKGAQLIGSQTTHQHNLTKQKYNIDNRQIEQHFHFHPQQPPKSQNEDSLEQDCIQLSDSIRMFLRKRINKTGNVFNGEQVSSVTGSQSLAIKSLQFNEKNKREAQILTKLRPHKHVVSIVHSDVYHLGPMPHIYIAMELCHEQNLHDHVIENNNNNVPFDPQLSISQAKQLVEGLSYIHSNNIIHRDLKPHNVLFSIDHQNLKIADFGISKPMTRGLTKTKVTNVGAGTDGYRAPEIFNNYEISQKADIYSLGLIFYFLWSNGYHPFGDDSDEWNINIKKNRNRDLSHLMVPDQEMATDLLQWMLQFEACNRPTTAQILKHRFFKGSLVSPGAETSPKAPATSSASGARSKLRSSSSSDVGRFGDEQQASTSTEQLKERSSLSVMTAEQRSEKATLASTPTSATETKRKLVNYSTSDVGNQPSTNGVQKKRRVSEPEDQAEKMNEIADIANLYFGKGRYQTAEGYWKKLVDLQKVPWEQLETLQKIAECHVMLDQPCVNDINNIISTCQSLQLSPDDVKSTADKHLKYFHLVRAYVMFVCASTMYRSCDAVVGITRCTSSMWNIVQAMENQPSLQKIASSQVIASMYDMLDQLREIKEVADDVKVKNEAWCLNNIGRSHYKLGGYNKALDIYNKAVQIMQSKFGSNSVKYLLFGHLLNNVGNVYSDLNNKVNGLTYYQQSIDAYQKAEDYSTEEEKQKDIETTKNNLRRCQNKIILKPNN